MSALKRTYGSDRDAKAVEVTQNHCRESFTTGGEVDDLDERPILGQYDDPKSLDDQDSSQVSDINHGPFIFEGSDNESTEAMPLPRMTVAQIMEDSDSDAEDGETAYDRMRKKLLQGVDKRTSPATTSQEDCTTKSPSEVIQEVFKATAPSPVELHSAARDKGLRLMELSKRRLKAQQEDESGTILSRVHKDESSSSDSEDIEAEIRLSSRRAPRRAATKKALEEMHKETERIQRSMTLAPEAQVKARLKISDFLNKVGYLPSTAKAEVPIALQSIATDSQNVEEVPIPPREQIVVPQPQLEEVDEVQSRPYCEPFAVNLEESDDDIELPQIGELMSSQTTTVSPSVVLPRAPATSASSVQEDVLLDTDSEDTSESELPQHLKNHALLFKKRDFEQIKKDRRAAKFVAMARPDSPTKIEARLERARKAELIIQVAKQAKIDRQAREDALRNAGVTMVSAEQRQKEALEIENLVEKARRQAVELRKLEQREDRKAQAEADGVNIDDESDHDWDGDDESDRGDSIDSSDSEDSMNSDVEAAPRQTSTTKSAQTYALQSLSDSDASDDEANMMPISRRKYGKKSLISDDEADSDDNKENSRPRISESQSMDTGLTQFFVNTPVQEDNRKSLGEISFTQFVDSPSANRDQEPELKDNSRYMGQERLGLGSTNQPFAQRISNANTDKLDYIPSSQPDYDGSRDPFQATQFSVFGPPSPDEPVLPLSPTTQYTQATVADQTIAHDTQVDPTSFSSTDSPKKHGLNRLRQIRNTTNESPSLIGESSSTTPPVNAFKRMRKALDEQELRRSRRALVDDRAVESDDEYAGLGGLSDEEPEDADAVAAELADMIDHDAVDDDEEGQRKIAAFYAQKDLENDEKLVQNLMNDINNGGLRRKRGAGLLDMDDSEDEEEEAARYKARQAQMRARLLESQNLTSLAENPKTKAFIEALEDRPVASTNFIEIAGEEEAIPETQYEQASQAPAGLVRSDTQVDELQAGSIQSQMAPPAQPARKLQKKRTDADIRNELSFLRDEESSMNNSEQFDPTFVPQLKRERSSLTIEDRAHLSRENSLTWKDPRSNSQTEESMYSQLAANRRPDSRDSNNRPVVVVSKGTHMASRMATKAVNYHARAARALKEGKDTKETSRKVKRAGSGLQELGQSKKKDVLKLFA